jgi:energy-coupling factor transport system permease protein
MPFFGKEYNVVRRAQMARGMEVSVRPKNLMRTIRLTFMPLLVSGLTKVEALAISMEGRGFGMHKTRTFIRKLRFTGIDTIVTVSILLITVAISIWVLWIRLPWEYHI